MTKKQFKWSAEKNELLKKTLNRISFEDVVFTIENQGTLDDIEHPSRPNQRIFVIEHGQHIYGVPYVESEDEIFLKTAFPSRKLRTQYAKKTDKRIPS